MLAGSAGGAGGDRKLFAQGLLNCRDGAAEVSPVRVRLHGARSSRYTLIGSRPCTSVISSLVTVDVSMFMALSMHAPPSVAGCGMVAM